jgi:FMN reductase
MLIVGLGGTTRENSSSERALTVALAAAAHAGAATVRLGAAELDLPMYAPENSTRTPNALRLLDYVRRADGLIVSSPGYHGAMSGLVKNALDYVEDLREDSRPYLDGRAFGTIAVAQGWSATIHTISALRSIAHALRAWPTPMAAAVNTTEQVFDPSGEVADVKIRMQLELVAAQVIEFATMRRATAGA